MGGWEWFWANVVQALVGLPEVEEKRPAGEDEGEDEMFLLLSRNPMLALVRRGLQHGYRK